MADARQIFQSTPPRGRRPGLPGATRPGDRISIHSAARAETLVLPLFAFQYLNFNPLRREGGDVMPVDKVRKRDIFQSTLPRGRRHSDKLKFNSLREFQSTPPRGRRPWPTVYPKYSSKFQSTPPRGRRPILSTKPRHCTDFNPLRREGGD